MVHTGTFQSFNGTKAHLEHDEVTNYKLIHKIFIPYTYPGYRSYIRTIAQSITRSQATTIAQSITRSLALLSSTIMLSTKSRLTAQFRSSGQQACLTTWLHSPPLNNSPKTPELRPPQLTSLEVASPVPSDGAVPMPPAMQTVLPNLPQPPPLTH